MNNALPLEMIEMVLSYLPSPQLYRICCIWARAAENLPSFFDTLVVPLHNQHQSDLIVDKFISFVRLTDFIKHKVHTIYLSCNRCRDNFIGDCKFTDEDGCE